MTVPLAAHFEIALCPIADTSSSMTRDGIDPAAHRGYQISRYYPSLFTMPAWRHSAAAFRSAALDYFAPAFGPHALAETMLPLPATLLWLIRSLRQCNHSFPISRRLIISGFDAWRKCSLLVNQETKKPLDMRSSRAYRPAILWCVFFWEIMYTIVALIPELVQKNSLGPIRSEAENSRGAFVAFRDDVSAGALDMCAEGT